MWSTRVNETAVLIRVSFTLHFSELSIAVGRDPVLFFEGRLVGSEISKTIINSVKQNSVTQTLPFVVSTSFSLMLIYNPICANERDMYDNLVLYLIIP
jgi:hypothetical protein